MSRSIVVLGGPDSGKTNYIGRLWRALDAGSGVLHAAEQPDDLEFVIEVADHLFAGGFAPRSEHSDERRDFEVVVAAKRDGPTSRVIVPDVRGELWRDAVTNCEIDPEWMGELRQADAALLFVRVGSDQDVRALDWVTSRDLLEKYGSVEDQELPTQVMLCELIRILELYLSRRKDGELPRLSVVVSAWDLVDNDTFVKGPMSYLEREYPLFAGRLQDITTLNVEIFGLSVVGGDLKSDSEYRNKFLAGALEEHGWVVINEGNGWTKKDDLTLPVAWAVGL